MATIPFALSIHHFISSVGADAGFAAIIGLAILVLLFFSQARETAALRRRAEDAEEALAHLETRINGLARSGAQPAAPPAAAVAAPPAAARIGARPTAMPTSAPVASRAGAVAGAGSGATLATIPTAPAGVGAPALSSATRLIPVGAADEISIRALRGGEAAAEGPAGSVPKTPNGGSTVTNGTALVDLPPAPSTAAAGARGPSSAAGTSVPAAATSVPVPAPAPAPAPRAPVRGEGGLPPRPAALPPRRDARPGPSQWRRGRVAIVLAIALVVIVIVAVLVAITSSGGSSPAAHHSATRPTTASRRVHPATPAVVPATVPVAVLNGTSTPHLAHDVMSKLASFGYKQAATPSTASDQTLTSTIVGYDVSADKNDALAVARSLGLSSAAVRAVSASDRSVACSATPTSCPARVIVTVGSDLSSLG
jgi:hypothetical protein